MQSRWSKFIEHFEKRIPFYSLAVILEAYDNFADDHGSVGRVEAVFDRYRDSVSGE